MKMRLLALLIVPFISLNLAAQEEREIDSFLKQLKEKNPDTAVADIYAKLCFRYCNVNPDSALWYGNKAMQLSVKVNYAKGIGDAYNNIGWAYFAKGDLVKAKNYTDTALQKFKKTGIEAYIAVPLSNLASIYVTESNYTTALSYYTQAHRYFQNAGDKTRSAETLFSIGRIYNLQKDYVKARSYFQLSYAIHKKEGNEVYMAQSLSSIANTYQIEGNYDTALIFYEKTIPVFLKYNDIYRTGNAYENISIAYQNKQQYHEALENMLTAEKYYRQLNSKIDMAYAGSGIAGIYMHTGAVDKAINQYRSTLAVAVQTSEKNLQQSLLSDLSKAYTRINDYKNAYTLLDSSNKIKDSLFTIEKQNELLKLQTEFETERKEKENELLKTQNLTASLQLARNRIWLLAAASALVIAIILVYALYKNRQAKIKNIQSLKELNIQLETQKTEISRINTILELKALRAQMNPHFIFNCMSSIQECMLTGRIEDANSYLTKLSRLLRLVLNCSDDENVTLDKELQMLNLYLQLEKIRLKNNFEYTLEMSEDIIAEELLVPTLIIQPFAENAIWHGLVNKSNDRQLHIKVDIADNNLHISIQDNGIGRKKAGALKSRASEHQSKAIKLVERRLSIINNKTNYPDTNFTIHDLYDNSGNATGTCVEIQLPLIVS